MKWYVWLIIALVAVIVLSIIFSLINRKYKRTYGINLFVGGFFLLLAVGAAVGGILIGLKINKFGFALLIVSFLISLLVFIQDVKRCGFGAGLGAWFCQLVFCVPTVFLIFDLVFNKGRGVSSSTRYSDRDMRYYREQQRNKRNDDRYY